MKANPWFVGSIVLGLVMLNQYLQEQLHVGWGFLAMAVAAVVFIVLGAIEPSSNPSAGAN